MARKSKSHRRKGLVVVRTKDNRLRLRLPRSTSPDGKQKDICLGLADTPENREHAEGTALEIEVDLRKGQFDLDDLEKYGITRRRKQSQTRSASEGGIALSLHNLYEKYILSKKPSVRPGTWKNGYLVTLSHIHRSPFATIEAGSIDRSIAYKICDWAIDNLTPDSGRRFMTQLNACFIWALDRQLVTSTENKSPFDGLASNVRKTFCRFNSKRDIESFSANERDLIIEAFRQSERYQCYAPYVQFCFFTGCRPSEAVALNWCDIATDLSRIIFRKVLVDGEGGVEECDGLKTQRQRIFPCNEQVKNILKEARLLQHPESDIVFPNKSGNRLTVRHFHNKPWRSVMGALPIPYKKPYTMRHTFITLCLEHGLDAKDVARLVGNSAEIIYKHYAGAQQNIEIPIFASKA